MSKTMLKRAAIGITTFTMSALPLMAAAQVDLGLEYATEIGLGTEDVRTTVSRVIRAFMGLLGIVAVVIILLGGFKWMTAGGDATKVDDAKKLIAQGIIGLIVIMMAFAIANFVVGAIAQAT